MKIFYKNIFWVMFANKYNYKIILVLYYFSLNINEGKLQLLLTTVYIQIREVNIIMYKCLIIYIYGYKLWKNKV